MTSNNKYFAFIEGNQVGPFELHQLAEAGVRPSTYVWCKGMDDWQRADSVPEVRDMFLNHLHHKQEVSVEEIPVAEVEEVRPDSSEPQTESRPRFRGIPPQPEPEIDLNSPPQVSMTLAVLSLLLCFVPTGIVAVFYTYKALKCWNQSSQPGADFEDLRKKSHEYERLSKMWLGLTVAFGIIFWTLLFSVK